ncbi:ATP-binding protein [Streptomyces sp. HNM0663]|uniref:ATP-binding protein n=1 Tax=Streptomyces chengmaiensis TaxID=3040919 RepID=A0ABT6HKL8_9ACTN|nr:ATP-binding protein [Streptomyces chengmaiensis]MDH2388840.1 ATP-binding protein [Streptomyces chengmaiensis]
MSTGPSEASGSARSEFGARLREELRASAAREPAVSGTRRGYRAAACLLSCFDPRRLALPGQERPDGRAAVELVDDCTATGAQDRVEWTLLPGVRETALRSLSGPGEALRALESNLAVLPDEPGPEHLCLAALRGGKLTPGDDAEQLADLLQAVLWLRLIPGMSGLPEVGGVRARLERARLMQPLERLLRDPFVGREAELGELRGFVDGRAAGRAPSPPLVIHGPGGVGKSTLLAAFLLDSLRRTPGFPFTYIDFERPTLSVHEPVTLIAESARQLGIQYPAFRAAFDVLEDECRRTARSQRARQEQVVQLRGLATTRAGPGRRSSEQFQLSAVEEETELVTRTAALLRRAVAPADPPFVLVMDSFEEAQYRASPALGRMWAVFGALRQAYPRLRVIASGRAPVGHPAQSAVPLEIALGELDPDSAVALLVACGVRDAEAARLLAERVGGHPLSLKLAARAALSAQDRGERLDTLIGGLPARRRRFFRRVDQMLVQGLLYERILHHIPDEEVRRLAHPGLVLRVITPEIIQEVLAVPCGLRVDSPEDARRLFDALARIDLVEPAGPDAVRHRPDVRAIMLRLSGSDRAAVMRDIEQRAVAYYAARDGVQARAEEIYHRLRLNESPRAVEERWLPGVERLLVGAQQEMNPRAAGLITAHLGGVAPRKVLAEADQEDWERIAAREVEDLLAQGFAEEALVRLGERRPWTPCSALHSLWAETLNRLGRRAEARAAASDAVAEAGKAGCAGRQLELLLLAARLDEEAGEATAADRRLRAAEDLAVSLGQDLEAMGALLARARLAARATAGDREADARLARRLRTLPDSALAGQPALVRAVASQVYPQDPGALDHAVGLVGLPEGDEALELLGGGVRRAVEARPALLGPLMEALDRTAGPEETEAPEGKAGSEGTAPADVTDILRLARERGTLDDLARQLLALPDDSGEIAAGVAAAMCAGSEGDGPAGPGGP